MPLHLYQNLSRVRIICVCGRNETTSHCRFSRGGARTEEPVCYLTGKSVTLCEDVQAARSRTASFEEKESRKGNSPPLGRCPRKKEEEEKRKESGLLLDRYKHGAVSLNEERVRVSIFAPLQSMAAHSYLLWSECR